MHSPNTAATKQEVSALIAQIIALPQTHIDALGERESVLAKAFDRLKDRVKILPEQARRTALSLFYRKLLDVIIEFHLAVEHIHTQEALVGLLGGELTRPTSDKLLAEHKAALDEMVRLYSCT